MNSPEPILDIVRGLSTIVAAKVVLGQVWTLWKEVFTSTCNHCHGTGTMTCPRCHGTKDLRKRPAQIFEVGARTVVAVDSSPGGDHYQCFFCGPYTPYDFVEPAEIKDDEREAIAIQDNLLAMLSGAEVIPRRFSPAAGVVACPQCKGNPHIKRLTPNLERLFCLEDPFYFQVAQRIGARDWEGRRLFGRKLLEYQNTPPKVKRSSVAEMMVTPLPDFFYQFASSKEVGETFTGQEALGIEEFVLPYIEDEDTDDWP